MIRMFMFMKALIFQLPKYMNKICWICLQSGLVVLIHHRIGVGYLRLWSVLSGSAFQKASFMVLLRFVCVCVNANQGTANFYKPSTLSYDLQSRILLGCRFRDVVFQSSCDVQSLLCSWQVLSVLVLNNTWRFKFDVSKYCTPTLSSLICNSSWECTLIFVVPKAAVLCSHVASKVRSLSVGSCCSKPMKCWYSKYQHVHSIA